MIVNKQPNNPECITKSTILLNKTSLPFSEEYRRISYFEYLNNNKTFISWGNNEPKKNEYFPLEYIINYPWKTKANCVYPTLAETACGKQIQSFQEISEVYYPYVAAYTDYNFKNNLSSVIYENNLKIEGEFILNNTVCEQKAPKYEVIIKPENMFFIPENLKDLERGKHLMRKVIKTLSKNYNYLLIFDITHLDLTHLEFNNIKNAFKKTILKFPEIFGTWEKRKCDLIFKEIIPGLQNEKIIRTNVIEAILQNYRLIKTLEIFDDLIGKAENKALLKTTRTSKAFNFETAKALDQLKIEERFDPIKEIRQTGIIEICENFKEEPFKKPVNWFTGVRYTEGSSNKSTPNCLEISKFLKIAEARFEDEIKTYMDLPEDIKKIKKLEDLGEDLLPTGEKIKSLSTPGGLLKPWPKQETALVIYNEEFALKQKKWGYKTQSKKDFEEIYPQLKTTKNNHGKY